MTPTELNKATKEVIYQSLRSDKRLDFLSDECLIETAENLQGSYEFTRIKLQIAIAELKLVFKEIILKPFRGLFR